jgi:hypothetical protein
MRASAKLHKHRRRIGSRTLSIPRAKTMRIRMRLSKAQKRMLGDRHRLNVRLTIVQVDPQLHNHVFKRRLRLVIRR